MPWPYIRLPSTLPTPPGSTATATAGPSDQKLRNQFVAAVKGKLASSGLPADYVRCVTGKAEQIPIDQLKALGSATAFSGNSKAAKALGERLGKQCIAEGAGVAAPGRLPLRRPGSRSASG